MLALNRSRLVLFGGINFNITETYRLYSLGSSKNASLSDWVNTCVLTCG